MKKLYKFTWYCGRQGTVTGIFQATDAEVDAAIGARVYFGEILGKHSEVQGTLDRGDLTVLTDDADFIAKAASYGLIPIGYNPLQYVRCACGARLAEEEHYEGCEHAAGTTQQQ